jgi:hypothetical protein
MPNKILDPRVKKTTKGAADDPTLNDETEKLLIIQNIQQNRRREP